MYAASHVPVSLAGHSDSIVMACAHTWMTGRHVSPEKGGQHKRFLLYHSLTKLVHGCAMCGIAHSGNIVRGVMLFGMK